jgi:hypothetical protein
VGAGIHRATHTNALHHNILHSIFARYIVENLLPQGEVYTLHDGQLDIGNRGIGIV